VLRFKPRRCPIPTLLSHGPQRASMPLALGVPITRKRLFMEERRFIIKVLAVEAAILIAAYIVLASV
jgi:hypothetical protein